MRILLLTPIHREKEFLHQKQKTILPKFQAQNSWLTAFKNLGHKVYVFRYTDSVLVPNSIRIYIKFFFENFFPVWTARFSRIKGKLYFLSLENFLRNRRLMVIADKNKPEVVIISGGLSTIYPSTIEKIKNKYNCRILLFSGVNPTVAATKIERILVKKGIVDLVVENDRGYAKKWERFGARKTIVLPISSADPAMHRKIRLTNKDIEEYYSDVCFVGTLTEDRQESLKRIGDSKYSLKIWGDIPPGTELDERLKPHYYGKAFGEKMVKIFNAAKIVLNFQPRDMTHGGNMRTFEISGCGSFQMANGIDPNFLKVGEDFASFRNVSDLKRRIKYYLQNDTRRLKIAEAGFKRVHRKHTYEKHFKKLLSQV